MISLPPDAVRPLATLGTLAAGVHGCRTVMVNVFAVVEEDRWVLVDAGIGGSGAAIVRWVRRVIGPRSPVAILLTHGHFDHVGGLSTILRTWDVPVFAHAEELPYLTGAAAYSPPDPSVGGGLLSWTSRLYPRRPIDISSRVRRLPTDQTVPGLNTWRWLHTPGHTAGHVSFFRPEDRTLLPGDALCSTKQESLLSVLVQRPGLHGPPAYFTVDWDAARDSVARLADLEPEVVAPSHGQPLVGVGRMLHTLAQRFDTVARPDHGRYVSHPLRAT